MEWIISNLGTIIVAIIVTALLALLIIYLIKQKKQGKTTCSCGCSSCPNSQICHSKAKQDEDNLQN